ncbi:hypothetical protein A3860_05435 [Niastella vici]|uniref:Lipoprotein n=1 Tax=Niastella vici TaxID=1703345 RepID=A0A1V9FS98_9BACT|nr:hypothetical protein [Niastella vici]OQP61161.1 hypothetical protein A3860_05435 [Niastella vici]
MTTRNWLYFIIIFFITSCNEMWGDHPLGNHLSLLEGDKKEDRIIVYCGDEGGICHGGIPIVPTYNRQFDEKGRYAEYVQTAISNKNWIIAETVQVKNKQKNYWIIKKAFDIENINCRKSNCDSIIQSYVTGPLSIADFQTQIKKLNIDLSF